MRKVLFGTAAVLLAAGCSDGGTGSSVATSVVVTSNAPSLNAVGATTVVRATVSDQKGRAMKELPLVWSSSSAAVSVVGAGGDSAVVTSVANGTADVTATAAGVSGSASIQVAQAATSVLKVGGDLETGAVNAPLGSQVRVQMRDRLNAPVVGQTVNFAVTGGGGSVSPATTTTDANGIAAASWTLGPATGPNTLTASFPGTTLAPLVFNATGSTSVTTDVLVASGGNQAAMVGTAVPLRPTIVVTSGGAPVAGRTVTFAVRSGGGTITGATTTTNTAGMASVGSWTLGPNAGPNELTATVQGVEATQVIRGVGCEGGGAGYAITLCFTTPMTPNQAQVFRASAARWATVIKGDLPDISGAISESDCGNGSPSANMTYDDLLIFAGVEAIDGVGKVLGSAGFCYRRTNGLPVIGIMRFDEADLASLETQGLFGAVILHEMGHVIGISSSMWNPLGLLQNPSSASNVQDTWFSGAGAIAGFEAIGGGAYVGAKVPVENTGGAGTANSHWRESVLRNELMTGYLNQGSNPLSIVTVRSLADLGYVVDLTAADNFFLTLSLQSQPGVSPNRAAGVRMHDDEYTGPQWSIDRNGRKTRLPSRH